MAITRQLSAFAFIIIAAAGIGGVATAAHEKDRGVTLFTPPLVADGSSELDCYIINVSDDVRQVTIEALDRTGKAVVPPVVTFLGPSEEAVAIAAGSLKPRSCRFTVDGLAKHFRASGLVRVQGVGSISALEAR